jgi:starch synthase
MASLLPLYLKEIHHEDPHFMDSKVVVSIYEKEFEGTLNKKFKSKLAFDGFKDDICDIVAKPDFNSLMCLAAKNADGIVKIGSDIDKDVEQCFINSDVPVLENPNDGDVAAAYSAFYDKLLETDTVKT